MNPNAQNVSLAGMSVEELTNLKEMSVAQIALNVANAKVNADRLVKQNAAISANVAKIDEAITALNA